MIRPSGSGWQSASKACGTEGGHLGYYDRAITLYTHLAKRFGVLATQAISCAPREAGYVLDGLLENGTLVRPLAHMTNTHGFTEHLLGVAFMPRLENLPDSSSTAGQGR